MPPAGRAGGIGQDPGIIGWGRARSEISGNLRESNIW
jgi:hypothetical protein